jgi:hypothetical protein
MYWGFMEICMFYKTFFYPLGIGIGLGSLALLMAGSNECLLGLVVVSLLSECKEY